MTLTARGANLRIRRQEDALDRKRILGVLRCLGCELEEAKYKEN